MSSIHSEIKFWRQHMKECRKAEGKFTEGLYGSTYQVTRRCVECNAANWYNLSATGHLLCLECGHQEEI